MERQKGPTVFLVVPPGEIIGIPQDSDKSWLKRHTSGQERAGYVTK